MCSANFVGNRGTSRFRVPSVCQQRALSLVTKVEQQLAEQQMAQAQHLRRLPPGLCDPTPCERVPQKAHHGRETQSTSNHFELRHALFDSPNKGFLWGSCSHWGYHSALINVTSLLASSIESGCETYVWGCNV
eukprot:197979-Amphidinium_carterae.1